MILLVIAVILAIIGAGLLAFGSFGYEDRFGSEHEANVRWVGFPVLLIAGLLLLWSGFYRQDPGDAVLIRGFGGNIEAVDTTSGAGWTAPWNKKSTWNTRLQRIELSGNGDGVDGPAVPVPSLGSNATMEVAFVYSIPGESIENLYNEHRNQDKLEENRLMLALRNMTTTITSEYDTSEIRSNRDDVQARLQSVLAEELDGEVVVDRVELGHIQLPESVEAALDRVEEAEADLARAETEANAARVQAQAESDRDQIARCGATTERVEEEIGGETRTVIRVVPRPEDQCQNRLNEQVLSNNLIDALRDIGTSENGPSTIVIPESLNALLNLAGPQQTQD